MKGLGDEGHAVIQKTDRLFVIAVNSSKRVS
jgi:hypothetical protein